MNEKSAHGLKVFGEMMGPDKAAGLQAVAASGGFACDVAQMAIDYAFADVWGRDGLERKQRSLVTLGILIAGKQLQELKNHVRIGVTHGLTVRELEEVLIQALPYVGFPTVASATTAVLETLRELGLDLNTKTTEEHGLL